MTAEIYDDRFGVSDEAIFEVFDAHRKIGVIRIGCYVPTRREVAEAPIDHVVCWLDEWWWESPTDLIPSDDQVREVIKVLEARPDASDLRIRELIADAPLVG